MARILTGIQSTGTPHLGNLLGAIIPAIELSKDQKNESLFFIADLHSFTTIRDAKQLKENTYATSAAWIAFGFDTEKNLFYRQSDVAQVCELTWYLNCIAPYQRLQLAHSFKDKSDRLSEVNTGLFTYPVLMAADILLYDASHVPVGDDQKQHLELCRDIAQKFNNDFGASDFLKVPEPLIQKEFSRIMSLKDGVKKMSKSDPSDLSRINLTDNKEEIVNKIKKAKTDPLPMPNDTESLRERPEAENLLGIYSSLKNQNLEKSISEFEGKNFSEFKEKLSNILISKIEPISKEIKKLLSDESYLDQVLLKGSEKADKIASKKMREIKELISFY